MVVDIHLHLVNFPDVLLCKNISSPCRKDSSFSHENKLIGKANGQVQVMHGDQCREIAFGHDGLDQLDDLQLVF